METKKSKMIKIWVKEIDGNEFGVEVNSFNVFLVKEVGVMVLTVKINHGPNKGNYAWNVKDVSIEDGEQ